MTDIPRTSVQQTPAPSTPQFKVGQRVQVDNIQADGQPGPYHACQGVIAMLFRTEEGQPAASILFPGKVQKKMLLTKLIPVQPTPQVERPFFTPPAAAPALPTWAAPNCIMVRGDQLIAGDIVYFSQRANPRHLQRWIDSRTWHGKTVAFTWGREEKYFGSISIDPAHWYVVERKS